MEGCNVLGKGKFGLALQWKEMNPMMFEIEMKGDFIQLEGKWRGEQPGVEILTELAFCLGTD